MFPSLYTSVIIFNVGLHECGFASVVSDSLRPYGLSLPGSSVERTELDFWSGLPCPHPRDLPDPGIEPHLLYLLHWQAGSLPLVPLGSPSVGLRCFLGLSCLLQAESKRVLKKAFLDLQSKCFQHDLFVRRLYPLFNAWQIISVSATLCFPQSKQLCSIICDRNHCVLTQARSSLIQKEKINFNSSKKSSKWYLLFIFKEELLSIFFFLSTYRLKQEMYRKKKIDVGRLDPAM